MTVIKWVSVGFTAEARAIMASLNKQELRRFNHIIAAIKQAPNDGSYFAPPTSDGGSPLRQMTSNDMHVIYRTNIIALGWLLQIVMIEIRDWELLDDGDTYGTQPRRR